MKTPNAIGLCLALSVVACDRAGLGNRAVGDEAAQQLFADTAGAPCHVTPASPVAAEEIELASDVEPPCRLVFRETGIILRGDSADRWPYPGRAVARDSRGRFFTSVAGNETQLAIWNPDGTFADTLGKRGDGPGELGQGGLPLQLMIDRQDRVNVRSSGGRWTVLDTALRVVRQAIYRNPWMPSTAAMLDDGTVLSAIAPQNTNHYFSIASETGSRIRSFGEIDWEHIPPELRQSVIRSIAYGGGQTFFAGPADYSGLGYVIEEWRLDGSRLRRFRRSPRWLRSVARNVVRPGSLDGSAPAPPFIWVRNLDGDGLLLTEVSLPNNSWRPLLDSERRRKAGLRFYNLHIEVIDPRAGVVLASEAVNNSAISMGTLPVGYFAGTRLGYRFGEGPDGLPIVSIVEYALKQRSR